jgi:hypothetical protein
MHRSGITIPSDEEGMICRGNFLDFLDFLDRFSCMCIVSV